MLLFLELVDPQRKNLHLQKLDFDALEETTEYDGGYSKDAQIIK